MIYTLLPPNDPRVLSSVAEFNIEIFKDEEKYTAQSLLNKYDWQVVRKAEKGTAMDSDIVTYRDGIRAAYETRKTEIDACSDAAALETLFGATYDSEGNWVKQNMTQYPDDPRRVP